MNQVENSFTEQTYQYAYVKTVSSTLIRFMGLQVKRKEQRSEESISKVFDS